MGPLGKFQEDTRDIHTFFKGGSGAIARTEIGIVIGNKKKIC
tara:strand:- start:2935 stop:3060 length:126 start_codon:yes stop_codon:yes gene_type:complete